MVVELGIFIYAFLMFFSFYLNRIGAEVSYNIFC